MVLWNGKYAPAGLMEFRLWRRCMRVMPIPIRTPKVSVLPVHPWSASGVIQDSNRNDMSAGGRYAFIVENSEFSGGSLTPHKPSWPNQRELYMRFNQALNKACGDIILSRGQKLLPALS
jgi:hypothetical protein